MCFDNSQKSECKLVAWITHVDESGFGFIVVLLSQTAAAPVASLLLSRLNLCCFVTSGIGVFCNVFECCYLPKKTVI